MKITRNYSEEEAESLLSRIWNTIGVPKKSFEVKVEIELLGNVQTTLSRG